ncbi:MAG: hypothetical protein MN733_32230, partial [Nitrososphaera sp.]|nr:hypothetical protein [Nitrososphaera sp.]
MQDSDSSMANTVALLDRLKRQMPEIWDQAQVVGKWIWLEFHIAPSQAVRAKLKEFGFHWNHKRKCWQNPCGVSSARSSGDPRDKYPVT